HAVLVISGAIDRKVARTVIAATFGPIATHGADDVPAIDAIDATSEGVHTLRSTFDQPIVALIYPSPAWGTNEAVYQQLAEQLVQGAMNRVANTHDDIDGILVFDLGGKRGGVTMVAALAKKDADLAAVEQQMRDGLPNAL